MAMHFNSSSIATLLIITVLAAPADAAHMADMDLASLWYQADIVVEGTEQDYKTENYWEHGSLVVTKVHKGQDRVKAGDKIDIALMTYVRKVNFSDAAIDTKEVVMFLKWNETGDVYRPGKRYLPVPSGIRLIKDDRVFRFQQFQNPGPYAPVLQGPERIDRAQLRTSETTAEINQWKEVSLEHWEAHAYVYNREALRKDLALAAEHVDRLAAAVKAKDIDKLASLLPAKLPIAMSGYYMDESGNIVRPPVTEKDRARFKPRVFVRRDYADAVAHAAAQEFVKLADRAKINAVLAEHKDRLTSHVLWTLESAVKVK